MPELLELQGVIKHVIFQAKDSSYTIAKFATEDEKLTICGSLPDAFSGQQWIVRGFWDQHPRYGKQFRIQSARMLPRQTEDVLIRFLSSEHFDQVGVKTAHKVVEAFGEDTLSVILKEPERLTEEAGISERYANALIEGVQKLEVNTSLLVQMMEWGISEKDAMRLFNGGRPVQYYVEQDPFAALYEVRGFGYDNTIRLANGLTIPAEDIRRLMASIYHFCNERALRTGDAYLTFHELMEAYRGIEWSRIEAALHGLEDKGRIEIEEERVYPYRMRTEEEYAALKLDYLNIPVVPADRDELEKTIADFEKEMNIRYDPLQKQALERFFETSLMVLNGGPGTGKSTVVRGIVEVIKKLYPTSRILLAAPTGRAAKRLKELTDIQARTIHSLLQWDMENDKFMKDEKDPLAADFLIIDEFSMVPLHVFACLLKAVRKGCRVLLIGDEDQLESVAPGKVFNDIIDSHVLPVCSLKTLFRQSSGSGIAQMAAEIREEKPLTYNEECSFYQLTPERICDFLEEQVSKLPDCSSFQILAPKYKGLAGIDLINERMQALLNPFSPMKNQISRAGRIFREGDRVLLKKNMVKEGVFNGDIGVITEVDPKAGSIEVEFDDAIVEFEEDFALDLTHAWCTSIHKAQGQEYQEVFLVVSEEAGFMLTRRLLYTGVSRAKRQLCLVGNRMEFERGVRLEENRVRRTTLRQRLIDIFDHPTGMPSVLEKEEEYLRFMEDEFEGEIE